MKEFIRALYEIRDALLGNNNEGGNDNNSEENSLFSLDNVPVAVTFYYPMIDPQTQKPYGFGLFDNEGENFIKGKYTDIENFCNELKHKNEIGEEGTIGAFIFLYEQNNLSSFNFSDVSYNLSVNCWRAGIAPINIMKSFVFDDNKTYYYFYNREIIIDEDNR